MHWYWKVRIHRLDGGYSFGQIITERRLEQIDLIQDFYSQMTGCKMLLEGMSEQPFESVNSIQTAFLSLWERH